MAARISVKSKTDEAVAAALAHVTTQQAVDVARVAAETAASVARTAVETAQCVAKVAAETAAVVQMIRRDVTDIVAASAKIERALIDGFAAVSERQDVANGKLYKHDATIDVLESKTLMNQSIRRRCGS